MKATITPSGPAVAIYSGPGIAKLVVDVNVEFELSERPMIRTIPAGTFGGAAEVQPGPTERVLERIRACNSDEAHLLETLLTHSDEFVVELSDGRRVIAKWLNGVPSTWRWEA